MTRVGLIGCGVIGSRLALAIQKKYSRTAEIVALHDVDAFKARHLQRRLSKAPAILPLSRLIQRSSLVIEAASGDVASSVIRQALRANRDVFIMSVGGLLVDKRWKRLIARSKGKLFIPSGALAGLDGIKAMALGKLTRASLTTSKPAKTLADVPYVLRKGFNLKRLARPKVVFEGTPSAVVRHFPQNTNVAAALALASGLPDRKIRIRVIADPSLKVNQHAIEVIGDCGRIACQVQSIPSSNPKTSELAVRSALAMLQRFFEPVVVGT